MKKSILKNQLNRTETKHYIDRCIFIFNSDKVFLLSIRETLRKTGRVLFHWSNAYLCLTMIYFLYICLNEHCVNVDVTGVLLN